MTQRTTLKACIFCGQGGPLTVEHLIPGWMSRLIYSAKPPPSAPDRKVVARSRLGRIDEGIESIATEWDSDGAPDFKARRVCADCNGGWMSDIEQAAMGPLTEMIEGRTIELGPEAREQVATWLALKGVVEMWSRPSGADLPSAELTQQFYADRRPPFHWRVRIGRYDGEKEALFGGTNLEFSTHHRLSLVPLTLRGFFFTFACGRFFGQVIGVPRKAAGLPINVAYHVPIWPPALLDDADPGDRLARATQSWPPERGLDNEELVRALDDPREPSE